MNKKNNNTWIICFGSKWSSPSVYTEKQLIKRFYNDGYKIFWIDPIPHKNISLKGISTNRSILTKILWRIKTHLKLFSKLKNGFYQLTPFFIPNVENEKVVKYNLTLLKVQVKIFSIVLGIKDFIVISANLTDIPSIFPSKKYKRFFQISGDLYSDLRNLSSSLKNFIIQKEKRVFNAADKIFAASANIKTKIENIVTDKNKVIYFPHGVEYEHFTTNSISKLPNISHPIAGYFGSLTDNNDQRMFIALAKAGFSVVLIGKVIGNYKECESISNIHFLGPIDYEKLPAYANNFDICIMAWKPHEWINNSNPSKTIEYLALGKPIVSNTIPEIKQRFKNLIYFADTPEQFVEKAKQALKENDETLIIKRKKTAQKEDWNNKYEIVKKYI